MMIQLSDGCHVAAEHIAEVSVKPYDAGVTVRMKDGIGHHLGNDYGKGSYETQRRLVAEINKALEVNRAHAQGAGGQAATSPAADAEG